MLWSRIKSYAKDKLEGVVEETPFASHLHGFVECPEQVEKQKSSQQGNNSYGFVECPEVEKLYRGDAFLRKDQYLDCFEVGDKVGILFLCNSPRTVV